MLAIVWHSRTGGARAMAMAAAQGAGSRGVLLPAAETSFEELLQAQGYLFICPENLGSMTGSMKEMFDQAYYPLLGAIEGRPYATAIAAGSDGEGAQRQIDRIATGWRLRRVAPHLIVNFAAQTPAAILAEKKLDNEAAVRCRELGQAMAEGIAQGMF